MVVQHNLRAMNSNRMLGVTSSQQSKSTEKLSSGYKINRAADDAAGLAISEKMRKQVRGLTKAVSNAQDGISCVQTAEGALAEVHDMLQRINELSMQAANGTNSSVDRGFLNDEVQALKTEINRISNTVTFNDQKLLDGNFNKNLQVGFNSADQIAISIGGVDCASLDSDLASLNIKDNDGTAAATAIKDNGCIGKALEKVSTMRSGLGAIQNRLEHTVNNLNNVVENTQAAESQIRDTDMATEMVKYSNNNILAQAGTAMLAQSNQANQNVLSLLG
jgi:flagellin